MLIAHHLSVRRGNHIILRDLTLHIAPGQIVALLGRNGAGKSTLLKAMSGEFQASLPNSRARLDAQITLNGTPLNAMTSQGLALTRAVLPQNAQFAFPFTALEIALLGRYPHGGSSMANRMIAMEALTFAGAAALAERDVTTLSGGELARVQLARVLAQLRPAQPPSHALPPAPRYLLLDEPTAALDLAHQHQMLITLRRLASEWNIGVLAIMHDPNLAARYADQLAWLANGTLLAQDTPDATMTPTMVKACLGIDVEVIRQPGKPPFAMACQLQS